MNWKIGTVLSLLATGSISTTTLFVSANNQHSNPNSYGLSKISLLDFTNVNQDVADQFFARFEISKQNPFGVVQAYMVYSSFDPASQDALNERIYEKYGFNSFEDLLRTYIINFNMENEDPEEAQDLAAAVDKLQEDFPEVLNDPNLAEEYSQLVETNFEDLYNGASIDALLYGEPAPINMDAESPDQAPVIDPNSGQVDPNANPDQNQNTDPNANQIQPADPNQIQQADPNQAVNTSQDPNALPTDPNQSQNQAPATPALDLNIWIERFNTIISQENFQVELVNLFVEYQTYSQADRDQVDQYMIATTGKSFGEFVYQSLQEMYSNKAYIDNFDSSWNQIITDSSGQRDLVQALWDIDQEAIYRTQLSPYYENLGLANPDQNGTNPDLANPVDPNLQPGLNDNNNNNVIDGQTNNQIDNNTNTNQNNSQIVQDQNQQVTAPVTWPTAENGRENLEIQTPNNNNIATPAPSITNPDYNPTNSTSSLLSRYNIPSVGTFTTLARRENRKIKLADGKETNLLPDFGNDTAWRQSKSPYNTPALWGQCTWFAWGRFYELYGFSPGFYGNGYECVRQLVSSHPELFETSSKPVAGSVFSSDSAHNHVGIVLEVDPITKKLTVQEGNLDIVSNPLWPEAIEDYRTIEISLSQLQSMYGDVVFANPKNVELINNYQQSYKEMSESKFIASQKALNQDLPLLAIDHYQDEMEKFK